MKLKCKFAKRDRPSKCTVSFNKGGLMMACNHCEYQLKTNHQGGWKSARSIKAV